MDDAEWTALHNAIDSIKADFPSVSLAAITTMVQVEHARFADKPIRDFVPVLVESRVREQLRHAAGPAPE